MPYNIVATPEFLSEAKKLAKKYTSLKNDVAELANQLQSNPAIGTPLGKGTYKIRLAIASKGKGNSGGARVITCVKIVANIVYLVSIYDKSEQGDITDKDLKERIKRIPD
ncbi:type II toxin-antitoxin system RelE/ParE family toxin [Terrimonas pollutisoli]|uniref:type II toxin-antitoxin system RelE/ParE family toxin n=1 Tax=Terrimonas pollutisoli TaxID=3034147 RepID=UPI0023EC50E1|nr:type II toxin-antitoxin system RelE/ParE family toxin [Terrimonas sp. H1YJ31]